MCKKLHSLILLTATLILTLSCEQQPQTPIPWNDMTLRDITTNQTFRISDFKDRVVVLETMILACVACVRQQEEIAKVYDSFIDEVVFLTLDLDHQENKDILKRYLNEHGFHWFYAISSIELNQKLEAEFGAAILNPPWAPLIILDKNQGVHPLGRGFTSAEEILSELSKYL